MPRATRRPGRATEFLLLWSVVSMAPVPTSGCLGEIGGGEGPATRSAAGNLDPAEPIELARTDDDPSATGPGGARPGFVHRDLNHVISTGQSLAVGVGGSPALSTSQPYHNLSFAAGVLLDGQPGAGFVPLSESGVETMSSGLANLVSRLAVEEVFAGQAGAHHDLLVSCHGEPGAPYAALRAGTAPYRCSLDHVAAARARAADQGQSYVVRAVTVVHGEADHELGTTGYADALLQWQADYESAIQELTGQSEGVPLLQSQISSWTALKGSTSVIPMAQLEASRRGPDRVVLVGPKYFLNHVDGVHLENSAYRLMGEYYAKAYRHVVLEGRRWRPLEPTSVTVAGNVISIDFHVPAPPLVLDPQRVSDPGNSGFEYLDDGAEHPAIAGVTLVGPTRVEILLTGAPGVGASIRYAASGEAGQPAGPTSGPRGNLRDSDATASRHGGSLYNWCVHFELPLPIAGPGAP